MELEAGTVFDRYRIEQRIGEGGMGQVYRARDTRLHRLVALKVLRASNDADLDGRLAREARSAAALNHPNAVSIFDVGEAVHEGEVLHYIAMELIEGRDLRTLAVDKQFGEAERLRWLTDVARALVVAHRAGLVHRDIKPENVMVRSDGAVKVLDFGLARRATGFEPSKETGAPMVTLTERGVVVGTPVYMSPEQLRGDPLDGRSDQFAWAVMAYEVLVGAVPWRNRTEPVHLIAEILASDPAPLSAVAPQLPPAIASAITRALSKSRDGRFESMDPIVEVLDAYLHPGGVVARSLPPSTQLSPIAFAPTVQSTRTSMAAAEALSRVTVRRRSRRLTVAGLTAAIAIALAVVAVRREWRKTSAPVPSASGADAEVETAPAGNPEAVAEFRQAMERVRLADLHGAVVHANKALERDPDFAPALLFLAIHFIDVDSAEARDSFRRAEENSARLSKRDRARLLAFKPFVQGVPPDVHETHARLGRLVDQYPTDAELRSDLADVDSFMGDFAAANAELTKALEIDPGFGYALAAKAEYSGSLGDIDAAERATEDCAALGPSVPLCTSVAADIDRELGRCQALEQRMRRAIAVEPTMPDWYSPLAEALFEQGRPLESVREVAQQAIDRATPTLRAGLALTYYPVAVDILSGRFAKADGDLRAAEATPEVRQSLAPGVHALPAALRVAIARETGRLDEAASIAETFLQRRDAWSPDPARDAFAMAREVSPSFVRLLEQSRRLEPAEAQRQQAAWLGDWEKTPPLVRGYVWLKAYADGVETEGEARKALEALPAFEPLPRIAPDWAVEARTGRVRLLAGDLEGALPALRRAATQCNALAQPFAKVHALADLGEALERTGDRAGACDAYSRVLSMWGHAEPRSVTATRVRTRAGSLGCSQGR